MRIQPEEEMEKSPGASQTFLASDSGEVTLSQCQKKVVNFLVRR